MRTAEERALELWKSLPMGARALLNREEFLRIARAPFRLYAMDQRRSCAEAVHVTALGWAGDIEAADACYTAALDAPDPGE